MKKKRKPDFKKKKIIVAVSGGFDPIHVGHIQMFEEAKKLGSELVVILNNDNWLKKKKGFIFMPQNERKQLLKSLRFIDRVVVSGHIPDTKDISVNTELKKLKPDIFANGGDRNTKNEIPAPEVVICKEIDCKMVFNVGKRGKVQSSSWLLKKISKTKNIY